MLGFLASLVGGWDFLMDTLVLLMVIDVLLGLSISMWKHRSQKTKSGRFASREFYKGVTRKFLCFIVIIVAVALDNLTGTYIIVGSLQVTLLRSIVVVFYILCEATSIIENLTLLGVPMPKKLLDMLEILKESNNDRGDYMDFLLIGVLAFMILLIGSLALFGLGFLFKHIARHTTDFIFFYRCIPRKVKRPDCKMSKYYDRFPTKDGTQWEYAPVIDDPWMKELADNVMKKIGKKSDRYRANYILHLVQYAYTYEKDKETYGTSEKWAFPVCTGFLHVGDCEDGALLGAGLSKLCGLDTVMISMWGHALYGVNVKGFGKRVEYEGKQYVMCETTAPVPMGISTVSGRFLGAYEVLYPPIDYLTTHTYEDGFEQYKE